MLQLAQELKNQVKHEESLYRLLQTFCDQGEDTRSWIGQLRETLDSLHVMSSIQERLNRVEVIERKCLLKPYKSYDGLHECMKNKSMIEMFSMNILVLLFRQY